VEAPDGIRVDGQLRAKKELALDGWAAGGGGARGRWLIGAGGKISSAAAATRGAERAVVQEVEVLGEMQNGEKYLGFDEALVGWIRMTVGKGM
jgi:hypothetical protein